MTLGNERERTELGTDRRGDQHPGKSFTGHWPFPASLPLLPSSPPTPHWHSLRFKIYFLRFVYIHMCMSRSVNVSTGVPGVKRCQILWSWSHRQLWSPHMDTWNRTPVHAASTLNHRPSSLTLCFSVGDKAWIGPPCSLGSHAQDTVTLRVSSAHISLGPPQSSSQAIATPTFHWASSRLEMLWDAVNLDLDT